MKTKKRGLSIAGSILGIIAWIINILLLAFTGYVVAIFLSLAIDNGSTLTLEFWLQVVQLIFCFVVSVLLVVLCSMTIHYSKKGIEVFTNKKATVVFVAIVNLLNAIYSAIQLLQLEDASILAYVAYIAITFFLLLSSILLIADISKANKELKTVQIAEANTGVQPATAQEPETNTNSEQ